MGMLATKRIPNPIEFLFLEALESFDAIHTSHNYLIPKSALFAFIIRISDKTISMIRLINFELKSTVGRITFL